MKRAASCRSLAVDRLRVRTLLVALFARLAGGDLAEGVVGAAAARVGGKVAEDRPTDLAPRRESEASVRIVERRLDARTFEEIAREVLAACLAHRIGLEERATDAGLCMFAEPVPRIRLRLDRAVEEIFQQVLNRVLHAHLTTPK